eukprot:jgi/Tetstr1/420794/TSEL_011870.t1
MADERARPASGMGVDAAGMFKHIRRQAGAELRKIGGNGGGSGLEGPIDPATLESFDNLLQQYEHATTTVASVAKQLRSVVSAELGLGEKQAGLQAAVRTAGQLLGSRPSAQLDTQIIPAFVAGGNSLNDHVVAIQRTVLPGLDKLVESHKALAKEVSTTKQQRIDYEHYVHKIKTLEESAKAKGSGKDFEKLASNQQKLVAASTVYQQGTETLMRKLERQFQDIALELGVALASLAKASAATTSSEAKHLESLQARGPAWLTAAPASHSAIVPAGNKSASSGKFGLVSGLLKGQKAGASAPPPPPGAPPSSAPPPMYTAGSGGGGAQLERRLAESEARNQAGAAAYDKLRAELDRTVEQLRVTEHLQQRADGELVEARKRNSELEQQLVAAQGGGARSSTAAADEAQELRRRLQEAEQAEQAYRIRINGLESKLRDTGVNVSSSSYPAIQPPPAAGPSLEMDAWNPFGEDAQPAPQPAGANSIPNTGDWNPFG